MLAETMNISHDNRFLSNMFQPNKENISQCYYNYEMLNHHAIRATNASDTLNVRYVDQQASPQRYHHGRGRSRASRYDMYHSKHSNKPIEVSAIANLDDSNGSSVIKGGTKESGTHRFTHPSEPEFSACPMISSELLNFNIDLPPEDFKSIKRESEDVLGGDNVDYISSNTYNRESHNCTLDSLDDQYCCRTDLDTLHNVQHPKSSAGHRHEVSGPTVNYSRKVQQYFRVPGQADNSINYHEENNLNSSLHMDQSDFQLYSREFRTFIPSIPSDVIENSSSFGAHLIAPPSTKLYNDDYLFDSNQERNLEDINAQICKLKEAEMMDSEHMGNFYPIRTFDVDGENDLQPEPDPSENPQLYSYEAGYYYEDATSQSDTSSMYEPEERSLPRELFDNIHTLEGGTDKIETISTHSLPVRPCIPHSITSDDEFSTNVSVNDEGTKDMAIVSSKIAPSDSKPKRHLLLPEFDKYWIGPDEDNKYLCLFENCGKMITRRYNIRSHIQTHLGDRPFACKLCSKTFVRNHDLKRHATFHNRSPRRKKVSTNCSRANSDASNQMARYEMVFNDWYKDRAITQHHHSTFRPAALSSSFNV